MAKLCSCGCGAPVFSKGLSINCWHRQYGKPLKKTEIKVNTNYKMPPRQKPIPKRNAKSIERDRKYMDIRNKWLPLHQKCEARLPGCTHTATEVHHKEGRLGDLLFDATKFLAVCRGCHQQITDDSAGAIRSGLSLRRII